MELYFYINPLRADDIYVSVERITNSSGNDLLPVWHQAMSWTYEEIKLKLKWSFYIQENAFQILACKMLTFNIWFYCGEETFALQFLLLFAIPGTMENPILQNEIFKFIFLTQILWFWVQSSLQSW